MRQEQSILTINGGSSSIKFALYKMQDELQQMRTGAIYVMVLSFWE